MSIYILLYIILLYIILLYYIIYYYILYRCSLVGLNSAITRALISPVVPIKFDHGKSSHGIATPTTAPGLRRSAAKPRSSLWYINKNW